MADDVSTGTTENAESAQERDSRDGSGVVSARDRFQRLSQDVQSRYREVSDEVRRGAERASGEIRRGTERARETYQDVAESARENYEKVRVDAGNLTREVGFYVRDNPGKALLMAAGVGFLLGLVLRGRDDDEE